MSIMTAVRAMVAIMSILKSKHEAPEHPADSDVRDEEDMFAGRSEREPACIRIGSILCYGISQYATSSN